jgi:hypothetical protein
MSNTKTDINVNPIGVPPNGNLTVSTVTLEITGNFAHEILVAGQFSADCFGAVGGIVGASILVDGNLHLNTQVNELTGDTGTLTIPLRNGLTERREAPAGIECLC